MHKSACLIKLRTKPLPVSEKEVELMAQDHLKERGESGSCFELEVIGAKRMRSLNSKFMRKNCPTDVLSFPLEKIPGEKSKLIGTVFVCSDIIKKQAEKKNTSFKEEFMFIVRHGIDHLLGIHHK